MHRIYLIRHGLPAFPGGQKVCIGSGTDLPLAPPGRMQAFLVSQALHGSALCAVFHSGMQRAAETARYLSPSPLAVPALQELDMGAWEGLSFQEIRRRYPAEYALRGEDPEKNPPPGGESLTHAAARAADALHHLLRGTEGDLAIVAHAGINRLLLCGVTGTPLNKFLDFPQPYGCINTLLFDQSTLTVQQVGMLPPPPTDETTCRGMLQAAGTPRDVISHCAAVASLAHSLCSDAGGDGALAFRAGLLHDIAKGHSDHARLGGQWLEAVGCTAEAAIIARHHDITADASTEAKAVYLADKLIRGTTRVSLKERFDASLSKCRTPEALAAHEARRIAALQIAKEFHIEGGSV